MDSGRNKMFFPHFPGSGSQLAHLVHWNPENQAFRRPELGPPGAEWAGVGRDAFLPEFWVGLQVPLAVTKSTFPCSGLDFHQFGSCNSHYRGLEYD